MGTGQAGLSVSYSAVGNQYFAIREALCFVNLTFGKFGIS